MYLTSVFLKHGIKLEEKVSSNGPDCCLNVNDRKVWVEAVMPTLGTNGNEVKKGDYSGLVDDYDFPRILRLTNAIEEKWKKYKGVSHDKDYPGYLGKIIKEDEPYIIAVNGAEADAYVERQMLGAVFAIGNIVIPFSDDVKPYNLKREKIMNANGSDVPTNIFDDEKYEEISAIIFSGKNVLTSGLYLNNGWMSEIGSDFISPKQKIPSIEGSFNLELNDGKRITRLSLRFGLLMVFSRYPNNVKEVGRDLPLPFGLLNLLG